MKKIIKFILTLMLSIFLILCSLILFDMADYDSSFINRKALVFSSDNLNSRHSHRVIFFLRKQMQCLLMKEQMFY